jgi:hypothetical protein
MDQPATPVTPKPLITRERLIEIAITLAVSYIAFRFGIPVPVPQVAPQSAPAPVVIVLGGSSTPTLTPAGK